MLSKKEEVLLHCEFMKLVPEMKEKVMVFEYLLSKGFSPFDAVNVQCGTAEYRLALDGMKYQRLTK